MQKNTETEREFERGGYKRNPHRAVVMDALGKVFYQSVRQLAKNCALSAD